MQFMQMAPMQKNGQQDQMMKLLQATLARGGQVGAPSPGVPQVPQQQLPAGGVGPVQAGAAGASPATGVGAPGGMGGFLSMMGQGKPMGLLGNILQGMQRPGAQAEPVANLPDVAGGLY